MINDSSASIGDRTSAIESLPLTTFGEPSQRLLASLLSPKFHPNLQAAAITVLGNSESKESVRLLLENWSNISPSLHRHVVAQLLRFESWRGDLLNALESKLITHSLLQSYQIEKLRNTGSESLRQRARRFFTNIAEQASSKEDILKAFHPALKLTGSAKQGQAFFTSLCSSCHRKGEQGSDFGPAVSTFKNAGSASILSHIIDPNREVQPRYTLVSVETNEGATLSGYLAAENEETITLEIIGTGKQTLPRNEIASLQSHGISAMPAGLEAGLSLQDMADLLAFLTD